MKRFLKLTVLIGGTVFGVAVLGSLCYFVYRNVIIGRALLEAEKFKPGAETASSHRGDPAPLERLRPHPWSSPLHDHHFDETVARARAAYEAGDYDRAIEFNTEALQVHPSPDLVWLLLVRRAACYLGKNDSDKALADYNEAAKLDDLDSRNYINRALAWRQKGNLPEAKRDLDAAVAHNPNDGDIYFYRGLIAADEGNLDEALKDYDKAVALNPKRYWLAIKWCADSCSTK